MKSTVPVHGVLLLGGRGTRVRALGAPNKHLLSVGGRPMAEYGFEFLVRCGIDAITAVVAPEDEAVYRYLGERSWWGARTRFVIQPAPLGTAHALELCADAIRQPHVAALWGDNLFEYVLPDSCQRFTAGRHACKIHLTTAARPQDFAVVSVERQQVTRVEDKPVSPRSATVCTGFILFDTAALFEVVDTIVHDQRGERDIMHGVRCYLDAGYLDFEHIRGNWFDAATSSEALRKADKFATEYGFNRNHSEEDRSE